MVPKLLTRSALVIPARENTRIGDIISRMGKELNLSDIDSLVVGSG